MAGLRQWTELTEKSDAFYPRRNQRVEFVVIAGKQDAAQGLGQRERKAVGERYPSPSGFMISGAGQQSDVRVPADPKTGILGIGDDPMA